MIFAVYAGENEDSIKGNLGMPDYSYYFVLKSYLPVLEKLGSIFVINSIEKDKQALEQLYKDCRRRAEPFLFLSFTPPHTTGLDRQLPTLTIFAWEYSTIPQEVWGGDALHDWRYALEQQGLAVTHSQYAISAVRQAMGDDYPIVSVPAPMWDTYAQRYREDALPIKPNGSTLSFEGCLLDSRTLDYSGLTAQNKEQYLGELAAKNSLPGEWQFDLQGVVYTAVMNPIDGRKNWHDLLWAFCWAFREHEDVTLLIKVTYFDVNLVWQQYILEFYKLQPFKCRVLLVQGFLETSVYNELIEATSFVVNSAHGEGQCLPLMEFMSAGKPAIAPDHTAMADYINEDNAFIVKSSPEWIHWPHDPRLNFRAFRYRINWESLYEAYLASYRVATTEPEIYHAMSSRAHGDLHGHCSREVATERLSNFFEAAARRQRGNPFAWLAGCLRRWPGWRDRLLRKYANVLNLHPVGRDSN